MIIAGLAGQSRKKMEELLSSMQDLTGGHALPVLAAQMQTAPQHLHSVNHSSAHSTSVPDQLRALRALAKEGAQALASHQASPNFPSRLLLKT